MEVFPKLPTALQHKILLHLKNPECDHLMRHWHNEMRFQRRDLLVDLNRYNYFRSKRKPHWDAFRDEHKRIILLDFSDGAPGTSDYTYKQCLQNGWWKECSERDNGTKLRLALFNMLEACFWTYHGDCDSPEAIHDTIYDPLETKRDIERDFNMRIIGDQGHPTYSHEEWAKRCAENGSMPFSTRKKYKAPRTMDGVWDYQKAHSKIVLMREKRQKTLVRRTWCRWRTETDDPNQHQSYYELCYPQ
jgi:hypothetical protein